MTSVLPIIFFKLNRLLLLCCFPAVRVRRDGRWEWVGMVMCGFSVFVGEALL